MTTKTNKKNERSDDLQLQKGTSLHITQPVVIAGQTMDAQKINARIEQRIQLLDASEAARNNYRATIKAERDDRPTWHEFVTSYRSLLIGMFANDPKALGDFNVTPRKKAKVKVTVKAEAVTKMNATRDARHTMGSRQKAKVKGTVAPAPAPAATAEAALATPPAPAPGNATEAAAPGGGTAPAQPPKA